MSDDWQVGDLAVCVDASNPDCPAYGVVEGRIYVVSGLYVGNSGRLGLNLAGVNLGRTYRAVLACRFRKIRPDEQEPCEAEFVTLLKRNRVSA
jgi:hypothetical protein